ncbi:MAG: hypothetical protein ACR2G3_12595 [Solirubrobacterales bacterium]
MTSIQRLTSAALFTFSVMLGLLVAAGADSLLLGIVVGAGVAAVCMVALARHINR